MPNTLCLLSTPSCAGSCCECYSRSLGWADAALCPGRKSLSNLPCKQTMTECSQELSPPFIQWPLWRSGDCSPPCQTTGRMRSDFGPELARQSARPLGKPDSSSALSVEHLFLYLMPGPFLKTFADTRRCRGVSARITEPRPCLPRDFR